jgi:hypothetical protein
MLLSLPLFVLNCHIGEHEAVQGTILLWQGDFQCCPVTGIKTPVRREVHVYELTNNKQATQVGYSAFFSSIQTKFITKTTSDDSGFYHVRLHPGKYSLFIKENSLFYANGWDGYGNIQAVEVVEGSVSQFDIDITYNAAF